MNINLWAGLGHARLRLLMFAWALTRPLAEELGSERGGRRAPGDDAERPVGDGDAGRQ